MADESAYSSSTNFCSNSEKDSKAKSENTSSSQTNSKSRSNHLTMTTSSTSNLIGSHKSEVDLVQNRESLRECSSCSDIKDGTTVSLTESYTTLTDSDIGDSLSQLSLQEPRTPLKMNRVLNSNSMKYKNGTRHSMSFTNENFHEIEMVNKILLKKIMYHKRKNVQIPDNKSSGTTLTKSALNRRQYQQKIDIENARIEKRIREAKTRTNSNLFIQ